MANNLNESLIYNINLFSNKGDIIKDVLHDRLETRVTDIQNILGLDEIREVRIFLKKIANNQGKYFINYNNNPLMFNFHNFQNINQITNFYWPRFGYKFLMQMLKLEQYSAIDIYNEIKKIEISNFQEFNFNESNWVNDLTAIIKVIFDTFFQNKTSVRRNYKSKEAIHFYNTVNKILENEHGIYYSGITINPLRSDSNNFSLAIDYKPYLFYKNFEERESGDLILSDNQRKDVFLLNSRLRFTRIKEFFQKSIPENDKLTLIFGNKKFILNFKEFGTEIRIQV